MWAVETVINNTNDSRCVPLDLKMLPAIPNRERATSLSANAKSELSRQSVHFTTYHMSNDLVSRYNVY
jgi:hypothetical protein